MNITTCFFQAWGHYIAGNKNSSKEWIEAALMCLNKGWKANQVGVS